MTTTILVVDDRRTNRDLIRTVLGYFNHHVVEAGDGREALDRIRRKRPDLVVTDILMPGMDGCELVRELRDCPETAQIPVIFYTANFLEHEVGAIARAYGVAQVLTHGADPQTLIDAVQAALSSRHPIVADLPDTAVTREHLRTVNAKLVQKIREMEATEDELRHSEERFRQIAESAPIGIILGDPQGRASYLNTRMADIVHRPTAELLAGGWRDHLGLGDWRPDLSGEQPARRRCDMARSDGSRRWLDISLAAVRDSSGTIWGTVGAVDDVTVTVEAETRQRELDNRLRVNERLECLGRLAGGVAHDFNNILTAVQAYAKFARETALNGVAGDLVARQTGQSIADDLERVLQAADRATRLTAQLLAFGRPDLGQPDILDVNQVVDEVESLLARTIGAHVTLTADHSTQLWPVKVDSSQLSQVLLNLAINARDAMPHGGHIDIRTTNYHVNEPPDKSAEPLPPGRYVKIAVQDDGGGIPPEVLQHVLEPFYTTKSPGEGTGLGLATVHSVVRQAGGHLQIESVVAVGTTVDVYLPAATSTTSAAPALTIDEPPGGGESILVVDDEAAICEIAQRILTDAGYRVQTAASGDTALALLDTLPEPIDVLLTDMIMPGTFGTELAEKITTRYPHVQVLIMSGYTGALIGATEVSEPAVTILSKPFSSTALLRAVRTTLDSRLTLSARSHSLGL